MKTEKVIEHIVAWLTDYATKAKVNGFVVGVSGGIDSALTSTLCAKTGFPTLCVELPIHQAKNQVTRAQEHISLLKNTFENVSFSKEFILQNKGAWGLITTASHMPRSFFSFKKQGIILEPIIVDYQTGTSKMFWINFDISKGVSNWNTIFHEIIGLAYYKVTNRI